MSCKVNLSIVINECSIGMLSRPFILCVPCEIGVKFNDLAVGICIQWIRKTNTKYPTPKPPDAIASAFVA